MRGMRSGWAPRVATYSLVAFDPETRSWGVGVQSKFLAVGSVVPHARAEVGAVATQAWANPRYGAEGLRLLAQGLSSSEVIARLVAEDEGRDHRQLGVVDREGRAASYTGSACLEWAGHHVGEHVACQGNILAGPDVVNHMARAYAGSAGALADRLVAALQAAEAAGGDRRGRQSAALLIVKEAGGYGGLWDRALDLRVDDHPNPLHELSRLVALHRLYYERAPAAERLTPEAIGAAQLLAALARLGRLEGGRTTFDDEAWRALKIWALAENLEDRWEDDGRLDPEVAALLLTRAGLGAG